MDQSLNGRRVAILVTAGFEQIELTSPREALEKAGAKSFVIAPKGGEVQGFQHHDKADRIAVDKTLDEVDPAQFDAVLLPGGVINADALRIDEKAQRFVQAIDRAGKPVAVICHGGWLLVSAGLVGGHTMTSWPTLRDDLRNAGAHWQDKECIRDRNWVSSRKPDDLPVFNEEMTRLFAETQAGKAMRAENRDSLEVRA